MPDTDHGTVKDPQIQANDFLELEERTSDPSNYKTGDIWYREDKNAIRFYDGVAVWQIPLFSPPDANYMDALTVVSDANGPGFLPMTSDVEDAALPQFTLKVNGEEYAVDVVNKTGVTYTDGVNGLGGEKLQHTESWETNDLYSFSTELGPNSWETTSDLNKWTEQVGASAQNQSSDQSSAGTYSWKFASSSLEAFLTNDQSGADSPVEAEIASDIYISSNNYTVKGFAFRYVDADNYYFVELNPASNTVFIKTFSGGSLLQTLDVNMTIPASQWFSFTATLYNDTAGHPTFDIQTDTDRAIESPENDINTSGGALGLGSLGDSGTPAVYFDQTEVNY